MARLMCIATHHKGGTVWIRRVVRALSQAINLPWIGIWSNRQMSKIPTTGRAFLCNWHGWFPAALWDNKDTAYAHVIRDPRDVLLSGCDYHQTAPVKGERFLHESDAQLQGLTYQQHLNQLPNTTDKLLFEMHNKHAETLAEMRAWPSEDSRCSELRYEDLMQDHDGTLFRAALTRLGLEKDEIAAGVQAFWDNSLFGGLAHDSARVGRLRNHISSGGRLRRWQTELPRAVGQIYADCFGADLIALGYEKNMNWVSSLPDRPVVN